MKKCNGRVDVVRASRPLSRGHLARARVWVRERDAPAWSFYIC